MGRWMGILAVIVVLTSCGIDDDKVSSAAEGQQQTTTTTTPTTTEPSATSTEPGGGATTADSLLLDAADLGSAWTEGSARALPEIPTCAESSAADPVDQAQAVFVRGGTTTVLLQTAGVWASEEQAKSAVARFASDIAACDNPLIDVQELSLPKHGDQQETAKLTVGQGFGFTAQLAFIRVGKITTLLDYIDLGSESADDFPTIVDAAAKKL